MMKKTSAAVLALSLSLMGCAAHAAPAANPAASDSEENRPTHSAVYRTDEGEALILSMGRALDMALNTNFTVLTAEESVESAKGQSKVLAASSNPRLALQAAGNSYSNVTSYPDNEAETLATVSQTLYSGGKNKAQARQGKLGIKQAEASLSDSRESVAQTVWNAYCDVLYRREVLRNTENALNYYTNAEKELRERVLYGLSTNLDLTRVRQQRESARAENISAGNNLEAARIELCRLLRLPPQTKIELTGSLEDGLPTVEEAKRVTGNRDEIIQQVFERRGDYQALVHAAASQKQEITVARSGMLPTLSLSGSYRFGYTQNGLSSSSSDNQWIGALTLDVPLYDGGTTSGNVRAAKANLKSAEHAVAEKEDSIRAELADNWLNLQNALETLSAGRTNVELARESLSYAESGYREGVNTQIDVLQARSELTDALQLLAQYLRDSREAQASLWKSMGTLIENAARQEQMNVTSSNQKRVAATAKRATKAAALSAKNTTK